MLTRLKKPTAIPLEEAPEPASEHSPVPAIDAGIVWQAAAGLTDDQREALTLRFKAELSIAEIASDMGKSEAAVKMLLQRAVRSLSERFR